MDKSTQRDRSAHMRQVASHVSITRYNRRRGKWAPRRFGDMLPRWQEGGATSPGRVRGDRSTLASQQLVRPGLATVLNRHLKVDCDLYHGIGMCGTRATAPQSAISRASRYPALKYLEQTPRSMMLRHDTAHQDGVASNQPSRCPPCTSRKGTRYLR